jgi:hypothetical protein
LDEKVQVIAVLRWDQGMESLFDALTVREVLVDEEQAESEVKRLNQINSAKGVVYFWQRTRFFPNGRSASRGSVSE